MTVMDYFGLALAAVALAIGLPAVFGVVRSVSRSWGWQLVMTGAAILLAVIATLGDLRGEEWPGWTAAALTTIGLLIRLRGSRKARAAGTQRAPNPR
jgi:hypothetical protein